MHLQLCATEHGRQQAHIEGHLQAVGDPFAVRRLDIGDQDSESAVVASRGVDDIGPSHTRPSANRPFKRGLHEHAAFTGRQPRERRHGSRDAGGRLQVDRVSRQTTHDLLFEVTPIRLKEQTERLRPDIEIGKVREQRGKIVATQAEAQVAFTAL